MCRNDNKHHVTMTYLLGDGSWLLLRTWHGSYLCAHITNIALWYSYVNNHICMVNPHSGSTHVGTPKMNNELTKTTVMHDMMAINLGLQKWSILAFLL